MKRVFSILVAVICLCISSVTKADSSINLTPVPKNMSKSGGTLTLPQEFCINIGNMPDSIAAEAEKFAGVIEHVTGYTVSVGNYADAFVNVEYYNGYEDIGNEGYTLDINATGINITAKTVAGFYYAFQSIKKMLPACVMAEVKDESISLFTLPQVTIIDAPRFEYRGFMLDVSRHFFSVDEIKRMIDVMSYYKMNRFHWHLTDDQGWRIEIKKYPRLTTVGAVRNNSWSVDPIYGGYYTNEPYGPYYYTQEDAKEVVAYAKERHIEVIPEVEFPGHSCAVSAAYPEFSCYPNGNHSVQVNGGIFSDVLNVANPAAVQFVKDVLDEIIEIFPYPQIHIGGDETPTNAWENNNECKALMQKMGYSNIRELQSHFVREISDHLTQKEGNKRRTVIMWNESLTIEGTNVDLIAGTGGTVMCWLSGHVQPGALQAAKLGMKSVITPWGPYYINRKQSTDAGEPVGAGYGDDTVQKTYEYVPVPADVPSELQKYYAGVQGTFWTEHVQSNYLLEYLALPRLIAIAETGWTPANKKNFTDFCARITKDTLLLDYNNYEYGRHFINDGKETKKVMPKSSSEDEKTWYRIVTTATDNRAGKCIELLRAGSPTIGTGNSKVNRLWNGVVANEGEAAYDYQLWAFMESPEKPGHYALVNKAKPYGSVISTPTAENNTGRWDYDESKRYYDFILGDRAYSANGDNYNYSIRSTKVSNTSMCMNFAGPGQTNSINLWSDPADGNGGIWELRPLVSEEADIAHLAQGDCVRIANNVEAFQGFAIADEGGSFATITNDTYAADVWEVATADTTGSELAITLRNVATGRYLSGLTAPITLGSTAATFTSVRNNATDDYSIKAGDGALFPMPKRATNNPYTLNTGGIYPQGSAWRYDKVYQVTYNCIDKEGNTIATYYSAAPAGENFTCVAPAIRNHSFVAYKVADGVTSPDIVKEAIKAHTSVTAIYERNAHNITYVCKEERGGIIASIEDACIIGEAFDVKYPEVEYFTATGGSLAEGAFAPTGDTVIEITYTTEGKRGFKAVGKNVTSVKAGASYLIRDAHSETSRSGFISAAAIGSNITTTNNINEGGPEYIWTLNAKGGGYTVSNDNGHYIPALNKGGRVNAAESGDVYTFSLNSDGTTFSIKGSNGLYWNANANNTFTGWTDGHPIMIYEYYVQPYFTITYDCIDDKGNTLQSGSKDVKAGDSYHFIVPQFDGMQVTSNSTDNNKLAAVKENIHITITYSAASTGIEEITSEQGIKGTYDLQGRKHTSPVKRGIYIVDGDKKIIK